jgi:hypothetical protein
VGNLEEVKQDYRRSPKDNPVDYAILLLREPKLFVEAKALGENLNDRKWAGQIMGYATVAGVQWVVITNGDEYQVYNACVNVPVEEKLFRAVRLTAEHSPVEETLDLLSKENIRDNAIEILWKAHFVDRQVRVALEELFSAETDPALLRLVKKRVRELSSRDIRASLARVRVRFDFPVEPELQAAGQGDASKPSDRRSFGARKAWETRRAMQESSADRPPAAAEKVAQSTGGTDAGTERTKIKAFVGVALKDVIDAGLLKPPLKLTVHYKGADLEADLLPDGSVRFQGKTFKSCSTAGDYARSTITGRNMNTNGWVFWQYVDQRGELVLLDSARKEYLKRKAT